MTTGNAIVQSGSVTPGHVGSWTTDGILQDGGPASAGNLTEIGVTNNGNVAIAINSGTITSGYTQFGMSVNSGGTAVLSVESYNGGSTPSLLIQIDGSTYPFPGTGGGNVTGPNSSTTNDAVVFADTTGHVIKDAGAPPFLVNGGTVTGDSTFSGNFTASGTVALGAAGAFGGANVTLHGTAQADFWATSGGTTTLSGAAPTPRFQTIGQNYAGTLTTTGYQAEIITSADTLNYSGNTGNLITLNVQRNFGDSGGTLTTGGRFLSLFALTQTNPSNSGATVSPQYVAGNFWCQTKYNSGGTGTGTNSRGSWYALNPQVVLLPGATYNALANAFGEIDISVYSTQQTLTISGTATGGDVISVTFTSSGISGSPVTVSFTVGSGNTTAMIMANLQARIMNNSALQAAGVTALYNYGNSHVLYLCWPTFISTVTVSTSVSGAATEVLTLGSVVSGASAATKLGMSIVRQVADTQPPDTYSAAIAVADQLTSTVGGWLSILNVGGGPGAGSQFPIAPTGSVINIGYQGAAAGNNRTQPFPPAVLTYGVDFRYGNFTRQSGAQWTGPGYEVDGTGIVSISNATLAPSSGGLVINSGGYIASGNATVASGGGGGSGNQNDNYYPGDLIYDDYGGQHAVLTTNASTGAVVTLRTDVQPYTPGSLPSSTLSTFGGTGTGLTINVAWGAATTLSLQSNGDATTVGGTLSVTGAATFGGAISRTGLQINTPSPGDTVSISAGKTDLRIEGGSTLATLTIKLPASPTNGQVVGLSTQPAITSLTVQDSAGSTLDVQTAPGSLAAGGGFSAQWSSTNTVWYCKTG